jgi:hypothetical protein
MSKVDRNDVRVLETCCTIPRDSALKYWTETEVKVTKKSRKSHNGDLQNV